MILYALADYELDEHQTIEIFSTRKEARAALEAVLADEPDWASRIGVVEVESEVAKRSRIDAQRERLSFPRLR